MKRLRNAASIAFLVASDTAAVHLAWFFGSRLRWWPGGSAAGGGAYESRIFWTGIIVIFFFAHEKLYTARHPLWDEVKLLLKAFTTASMFVAVVAAFTSRGAEFPDLILSQWLFGLATVPLFRLAAKRMLRAFGLWKECLLIIGAGEDGLETARGILLEPHMGYEIAGFLDSDPGKTGTRVEVEGRGYPVLDTPANFRRRLNPGAVGTVVIALPWLPPEKLAELTNAVQKHVRHVILVPPIKGISLLNTELRHLFSKRIHLLSIRNSLKSPFNRLAKNTFDVVVSVLLMPLLLPAVALIALLIKAESPGPVFFTHERVGRGGRRFRIMKFRSMYADAQARLASLLEGDPAAREEWRKHYKLKSDPRITRVGSFLRKTSLDELPQIFNVLAGQMSLVGPRPVLQEEIDAYYGTYADYYFMVKPGITGLWQVSGRSDTGYERRVGLDAWYVMNWTLWFDVVILFKTLRIVVKREGAY